MGQKLTTRTKYLVLLAVTAVISLSGLAIWMKPTPTPAPREAAPAAAIGGTITTTIRGEPRSFNRYVARDASSELISQLINAKLVRTNQITQEPEPWLAESVIASADRLSYTLKLRDGITFSDGAPFSSADVLFSFEAVYDERTGSPIGDALRIGGQPLKVAAPDALTVVVTFPSAFGPGVRLLDNLPIFPKHRLARALADGTLQKSWGVTTPPSELAGLGPFVVAEYVPGQRLVFARNPHYWRRDADGHPLPYLDRLVVEVVPDQNSEILRLQSGQIDFTQSEVRPEDYSILKREAAAGRLRLVDLGVGLDPSFLWFNLNPEAKQRDPRHVWLQATEWRRAISMAVDRESFANTVFLGAAVPIQSPVTPGNRRWFSDSLPPVPYDLTRARELLGGLDLRDRDGDGMLDDARMEPVRFSLLTQKGNTSREKGAAVIQEDLRKIGIGVDVVALEPGALVDRFSRGDYDAIYYGTLATDTDPAVNLDFWLSSGGFHAWNPGQPRAATDWEQQIDQLMQRQVSVVSYAERKQLFDEVQRIFAEHTPAIYFAAPRVYVAMSARVRNATPVLLRPQILWNADTLAVANSQVAQR